MGMVRSGAVVEGKKQRRCECEGEAATTHRLKPGHILSQRTWQYYHMYQA